MPRPLDTVNPSEASPAEYPQPPAMERIRKRDGEIVRFDLEKLTRSVRLAAEDSEQSMSPETVAELGRMSSFFVRAHGSGQIIAAEEAAEWVEKSLHQTTHHAVARAYRHYAEKKLWAHRELIVRHDHRGDVERAPADFWDKSRIVQTLQVRFHLDARRSREIASRVEHRVLLGRFAFLTTDLIREIVNSELEQSGFKERLDPSRQVRISTADLKRQLGGPAGPTLASTLVASRIWRDFSLHEVVSPDVAEADRRGLLRIYGLHSPVNLAATCIDCSMLIRQARDSRESIAQFGSLLAGAVESASMLIAIDGLEPWLTMIAEPKDEPARLAEHFWVELQSRVRHRPTRCVLNLYGGMPQSGGFEFGVGPLFGQQPLSAEREFAGAVSQEILGLFRRDGAGWPNLRVDWHWYVAPDPVQTALQHRIMRLIAEGLSVAIVYERGLSSLGEGLRRSDGSIRPVLDYIGVSLATVWQDSGSPRSLAALDRGVRRAIELAVRSAVERREFARRLLRSTEAGMIDSAVIAVFPIGLDWTVRQLAGKGFAEDEGALRLAESSMRILRDAVQRESRHFALGVVLDHPSQISFGPAVEPAAQTEASGRDAEGLSATGRNVGLRRQIAASGRLHAIAQAGTLCGARNSLDSLDRLHETIDWACRTSELVRLRLVAEPQDAAQGTVSWPEP